MTLYSYHIKWKKHVPANDTDCIIGCLMLMMKLK